MTDAEPRAAAAEGDDTPAGGNVPADDLSRWQRAIATWRRRADAVERRSVRSAGDVVEWMRGNSASLCLGLVIVGITLYTVTFASLGVRNHRNFGTWAYDMAIYDQAFWLVSRFGDTFMTARGMDVWGHHLNLVAFAFAPFYWLGAGPEFLYIVQSFALGLGALPVYLIAKHRFARPSVGLAFAVAYLMYAPLQNINWRDFHPEALAITPFLFAWYCAITKRWRLFFAFVLIALAMREDVALAVIGLGIVLAVVGWRSAERRREVSIALGTIALGAAWYVLAVGVIIPHFNRGNSAFYLEFFFSRWGGSFSGIVENVLRHPNWVVSDMIQPDRARFYRNLFTPLGGLPLMAPLYLVMAGPQLLASTIGDSPYARDTLYQYTAVMVAPIMIAAIEGAHFLWSRFRFVRRALIPYLLVAVYLTNVAWSTGPFGDYYPLWARFNPRAAALREAVTSVPGDAATSSTFNLTPHLSHREQVYDWPNPFFPAYWANTTLIRLDCDRFPSPEVIDYLVLDLQFVDPSHRQLIDAMVGPEGDFEVVSDSEDVLVARRVSPGPGDEALAPNCPGMSLDAMLAAYSVPVPNGGLPGDDPLEGGPDAPQPPAPPPQPEATVVGGGRATDSSRR